METEARRNRKFKAFLLVFFIITALRVFERLTGDQFENVLIYVFGLFMAGNGIEHASQAFKK